MAAAPPTKPSNAGLFSGFKTAVGFDDLKIFRSRQLGKARRTKALEAF